MTLHEFWTPKLKALTDRPLQGKELEHYYVERPDTPTDRLRTILMGDREITHILFSGHRGSGKSSELRQLESLASDELFVVWLDAEINMDLPSVNYLDILYGIGLALYEKAEAGRLRLRKRLLDDLTQSLSTLITEETKQRGFRIDPGAVLKLLKIGGSVNLALGTAKVISRRREVPRRVNEVIDQVNLIAAEVERKAGRLPLVIVDGLDKLDLEPAKAMFAYSQLLTKPTCRIVYAAPIVLYHSTNFQQAKQQFAAYELPNVRIQRPKGMQVMRDVIIRRIGKEAITRSALNLLAEKSGGVMRHLIDMARDAATWAESRGKNRIGKAEAEQAAFELKRSFSAGLRDHHLKELKHVMDTGQRTDETFTLGEVTVSVGDQLLQNLYILRYYDEEHREDWLAVHPLVKEIVEDIKKATALESPR